MGDHWRGWTFQRGGTQVPCFSTGGVSTGLFDVFVFGDYISFWCQITGSSLKLYGVPVEADAVFIASCPLPNTLKDTVAWLRLAAACHGGDHG